MKEDRKPIYRILLFSKIPTLNERGWPDCGTQDDVGFYYEYETAVQAMHENWCDIHECTFMAGFILTHFPGLYEAATIGEYRTYFEWDEERGGFFEKEEPDCFEHFSY